MATSGPPAPRSGGSTPCIAGSADPATRRATRSCRCGSTRRLIDSTIVANDAWIEPMSRDRRAAFYAETRPIGRAFGVPDDLLPRDIEAFEDYVESMLGPGGPIEVSAVARELGRRRAPAAARTAGAAAAVRPGVRNAAGHAAGDGLRLDVVAGRRPPARPHPRGLRACPGAVASGSLPPGWWRSGGPRARGSPTAFRQMPQALAADRACIPATRARTQVRASDLRPANRPVLANRPGVDRRGTA